MVSFESFDNRPDQLIRKIADNYIERVGIQNEKYPYVPAYDRDSLALIPDYRYQLYWDPEVLLEGDGAKSIQFYSSDISGLFEVAIEGFDLKGLPHSIKQYFYVFANE